VRQKHARAKVEQKRLDKQLADLHTSNQSEQAAAAGIIQRRCRARLAKKQAQKEMEAQQKKLDEADRAAAQQDQYGPMLSKQNVKLVDERGNDHRCVVTTYVRGTGHPENVGVSQGVIIKVFDPRRNTDQVICLTRSNVRIHLKKEPNLREPGGDSVAAIERLSTKLKLHTVTDVDAGKSSLQLRWKKKRRRPPWSGNVCQISMCRRRTKENS
jgi:hypothetical protein